MLAPSHNGFSIVHFARKCLPTRLSTVLTVDGHIEHQSALVYPINLFDVSTPTVVDIGRNA